MELKTNNVSVSVFAYTDIGRQRSENEDAFLIADLTTGKVGLRPDMITHPIGERGSLLIVSDGMGGAAAGEVASELAVRIIRQSLLEMHPDIDVYQRLKIATEVANESIWNEAKGNASLQGMGATVTAALVQGTHAYLTQVGDSRAYLIRGEQIKQITKDQSYAQMLVDSGAIKPEQMDSVPQNIISQALGTQPGVQVALTSVQICRNDYLILCSDGLSGKIQPDEMRKVMMESSDLSLACRRLIAMANERGGEDNITVVAARFDGFGLEVANEKETISGTFKALDQGRASEKSHSVTMPLSSLGSQTGQELPGAASATPDNFAHVEDLQSSPTHTAPLRHPTQPIIPLMPEGNPFLPGQEPVHPNITNSSKVHNKIAILIICLIFLLLIFGAAAFLIYRFWFMTTE